MAGGVFISYRRSDSAAFAGRIADFFAYNYPDIRVFFDVNGIAPGEDFVEALRSRILSSEVVLAIIGDGWLNALDGDGNRRLENPNDFVRIELSTALSMGACVVPVLLDDARMPAETSLPDDMRQLAFCNAEFMRSAAFQRDAKHLADFVSGFLASSIKTVTETDIDTDVEQGSAVYESLVQDFEAYQRAEPNAYIIIEDKEGRFVQFVRSGDDSVLLDLPLAGLTTDDQKIAARQFFLEQYEIETDEFMDHYDAYQVILPLDAGYLAKATLEIFERIYAARPTEPLDREINA